MNIKALGFLLASLLIAVPVFMMCQVPVQAQQGEGDVLCYLKTAAGTADQVMGTDFPEDEQDMMANGMMGGELIATWTFSPVLASPLTLSSGEGKFTIFMSSDPPSTRAPTFTATLYSKEGSVDRPVGTGSTMHSIFSEPAQIDISLTLTPGNVTGNLKIALDINWPTGRLPSKIYGYRGPSHPSALSLPVKDPISVQVTSVVDDDAGTVTVEGTVTSPFGVQFVDASGSSIAWEGGSAPKTVSKTGDYTWVWKYGDDGPEAGQYTAKVTVKTTQSNSATGTSTFEIPETPAKGLLGGKLDTTTIAIMVAIIVVIIIGVVVMITRSKKESGRLKGKKGRMEERKRKEEEREEEEVEEDDRKEEKEVKGRDEEEEENKGDKED